LSVSEVGLHSPPPPEIGAFLGGENSTMLLLPRGRPQELGGLGPRGKIARWCASGRLLPTREKEQASRTEPDWPSTSARPVTRSAARWRFWRPRFQLIAISADPVSALASGPESLNLSAISERAFDRAHRAVPLDRETLVALVARFVGIRQFARGGRRAPHKPLLLLCALARLKHDRQTEIRFHATEAIVNPLLRADGPWGSGAHMCPIRTAAWSMMMAYGSGPIAPARRHQGQCPRGDRAQAGRAGRLHA
jgi:hypothetical protein